MSPLMLTDMPDRDQGKSEIVDSGGIGTRVGGHVVVGRSADKSDRGFDVMREAVTKRVRYVGVTESMKDGIRPQKKLGIG